MKKLISAVMIGSALVATSCGNGKLTSGVQFDNLDTTASPTEDFYQYACGGWMAKNPLKAEYSRYGSFDQLAENNQEQLKGLITELSEKKNEKGSVAQKIGDLYRMGMDTVAIEAAGATPLQPRLQHIAGMQSKDELTAQLAQLAADGVAAPLFGVFGEANPMDSRQCIAWVWQSGLFGDRDYYLDDNEQMQNIRAQYLVLLGKLMRLSGYDKLANIDADQMAQRVLTFETELAKAFMDKETSRDPYKTFNLMSVDQWQALCPAIDVKAYMEAIGLGAIDSVNIGQVEYQKALSGIIEKADLNVLKAYMACDYISGVASFLSDDFVNARFDFFGRVLSGKQEKKARWKRMVAVVDGSMGEAVGQMYVEKYFPPKAKERMLHLVANLQDALRERIAANTWMADSTKQKAFDKLAAFTVKIGYPDKWRDYSALEINPEDGFFANIERVQRFETEYATSKIGKPTDPTEWYMTPQTVNAYYNPSTNEICFPAGILQPPFFDMNADDAVNYGAIGVVIGHEMTHGFDDQGRNYDKEGNLNNWWSESDAVNFEARTKVLVDYFDKIEVLPGVFANGAFTLGENIADNGGLNVSFVALQKAKTEGRIEEMMDGFTAEQRFFLAYAGVWANNTRDEEILRRVKEDPHSLGRWRVNGTLPHIDAFADTWQLHEGNAMYLAPEKRARIW
jgi:putative endopeptidase